MKRRARAKQPPPRRDLRRLGVRLFVAVVALVALAFAARSLFQKTPPPADEVGLGGDGAALEGETSMKTKNGLVWLRYPSGYSATALDDATIEIDDEFLSLTIGGVKNPYTEDASILAEQMLKTLRRKLGAEGAVFGDATKKPATCLGKYPGVETEESVEAPGARTTHLHGCFFVHDHTAVLITWLVPDAEKKREQRALDRIFASIELHELVVPNWDEAVATTLPNGLLVAHHPRIYTTTIRDDRTVVLRGPDRSNLTFTARSLGQTPPAELEAEWWASVALSNDGLTYREEVHRTGTCFGKHRGTEAVGKTLLGQSVVHEVRSCYFVADGKAYATSFAFPVGQRESAEALQKIVDAMEIAAP